MKTISFSRVVNTLSDSEMRYVKGGLDKPIVQPEGDNPVPEPSCAGSILGANCKIPFSGGEVSGTCALNTGTGKLECKPK